MHDTDRNVNHGWIWIRIWIRLQTPDYLLPAAAPTNAPKMASWRAHFSPAQSRPVEPKPKPYF
jgi:hypothetical protein